MSEDFKLLSLREEKQLSESELLEYYARLRKYASSRELQTTTKGALTIAPRLRWIVNKVNIYITKKLAGGNLEYVADGMENIPKEGGVLFASTHQGILDNLCWTPSNPRHTLILHTADTNKFLLWAQLWTGLILVNRNKTAKNNRRGDAKMDMISALIKGRAVFMCPEATWNLSPNKLHLPLFIGAIEVAQKANVPIIPMVTEFTHDTSTDRERITKIHIRYGAPINISVHDDLLQKLDEYKEAISTIRWELIEEKGVFSRENIDNWDYINYLKGNYRWLQAKDSKVGWKRMLEIERKNIRGWNDDYYLFHHINNIPHDEDGNLLETDEIRRLQAIELKNRVNRILRNMR